VTQYDTWAVALTRSTTGKSPSFTQYATCYLHTHTHLVLPGHELLTEVDHCEGDQHGHDVVGQVKGLTRVDVRDIDTLQQQQQQLKQPSISHPPEHELE
jgi:hypothetical protein